MQTLGALNDHANLTTTLGLFKALHEGSAGEALVDGWVLFVPQEPHLLFTTVCPVRRPEREKKKKKKDPSGFHLAAFSQTVNQVARSLEGKTAP